MGPGPRAEWRASDEARVGGCGRGARALCCWGPSLMAPLSVPLLPQSNKVPVVQHPHHVHPLTPLITYSNEHFTPGNPPPHLPADVDPKTGRPCAREGVLVPGPPEDLPGGVKGGDWRGLREAPFPPRGVEKEDRGARACRGTVLSSGSLSSAPRALAGATSGTWLRGAYNS